MTKYFERLQNAIISASNSDNWEEAVNEWLVYDLFFDEEASLECLCGKKHLKYGFSIKNTLNETILSPIGSTCIMKFGREDLNDELTVCKDLFEVYHEIKDTEKIRSISNKPKLFHRTLLWYLYNKGAFRATKYNGFDPEISYNFIFEMFYGENMSNKEKSDPANVFKVKRLIHEDIIPFIAKLMKMNDSEIDHIHKELDVEDNTDNIEVDENPDWFFTKEAYLKAVKKKQELRYDYAKENFEDAIISTSINDYLSQAIFELEFIPYYDIGDLGGYEKCDCCHTSAIYKDMKHYRNRITGKRCVLCNNCYEILDDMKIENRRESEGYIDAIDFLAAIYNDERPLPLRKLHNRSIFEELEKVGIFKSSKYNDKNTKTTVDFLTEAMYNMMSSNRDQKYRLYELLCHDVMPYLFQLVNKKFEPAYLPEFFDEVLPPKEFHTDEELAKMYNMTKMDHLKASIASSVRIVRS